MARVTVEDCTVKIPSRFELVVLAAHRAKEIASGAKPTLERDNDKNPVLALREIAESTVEADHLRDSLVKKYQKNNPASTIDAPEEDDAMDLRAEISSEIKSLASVDEDDLSDDAFSTSYADEIDSDED